MKPVRVVALRRRKAALKMIHGFSMRFSEKIEALASRVQAAAGLEGDWEARGRERGVQVNFHFHLFCFP